MRKLFFMIALLTGAYASLAHAQLNPLLESTSRYQNVRVERVISADTILINGNEKVMLIGIKAPNPPKKEYAQRDSHGFIVEDAPTPETPVEVASYRFAADLLEGKTVSLQFDSQRRNEDNVLEAYVFLPDKRMANIEILRNGFADLKIRPPNMLYVDKFRSAYQEARREMRGVIGQ
ncbi:MAG: thermonuclease family protein [Candidatus Omnitrophica bacterium]|nr:thermonuclease family protein [Candidatus Omnitrophota bacterium]